MYDADLGAARECHFSPSSAVWGKKRKREESFCGGSCDGFLLSSRVGNERSYK